jgi:molecular chaperone DnaK
LRYSLGIDFGTSTTKVALRRGNEIPEPLPIGQNGDYSMPSVVAYRRTAYGVAEPVVGEDAAVIPDSDEVCVIREIKRCLAAAGDPGHQLDPASNAWWNGAARCAEFAGCRFLPEDVILHILIEALHRGIQKARDRGLATDIDEFTVRGLPTRFGCPVSASLDMRQVLAEVARRLGFSEFGVTDLREEPILAALSYAHLEQAESGDVVLVYDLGGGSFDTALIQVDRPRGAPLKLTVLAVDGEPFCGGADIDMAFSKHVALRYLDQDGTDGDEYLTLLTRSERQNIHTQATLAKETLSVLDTTPIVFSPGTLGPSAVQVDVHRHELETVVQRIRLVESTLDCVLRAWRRARMVLRFPGEAVGDYYLREDAATGILDKPILKLSHNDLCAHVQQVLLVGGTTRMPLIRRQIAGLWGESKLIRGDVVRPLEAVATGAAWQDEEISSIVDRLPFSIVLVSDRQETELYRAFTPTVVYQTRTAPPRIIPFRSHSADIPTGSKGVKIVVREPDGHVIHTRELTGITQSSYFIEIDSYGQITLRTNQVVLGSVPNPVQHQLQREAWAKRQASRQQLEEVEATRARKLSRRNVCLEND